MEGTGVPLSHFCSNNLTTFFKIAILEQVLQALLSDDYDQMKKGLLNIDTAHLEDIAWTPVNQTDPVDKKYEEKLLKLGVDRFMDRILDFYNGGTTRVRIKTDSTSIRAQLKRNLQETKKQSP